MMSIIPTGPATTSQIGRSRWAGQSLKYLIPEEKSLIQNIQIYIQVFMSRWFKGTDSDHDRGIRAHKKDQDDDAKQSDLKNKHL